MADPKEKLRELIDKQKKIIEEQKKVSEELRKERLAAATLLVKSS